jgi:tRNA (guanine37-N1)-methyltransferase
MRIDIITVHPPLLHSFFEHSIISRAIKKGLLELQIHNLRDYSNNQHRSVDDYPYGGGPGMVLSIEPLAACIDYLKSQNHYDEIILMTPDGVPLYQGLANELSNKASFIIICGHYKGVDDRIRELYVIREISIGDYVLTGGEIPAAVLVDAITRLLPGVLNDESSALSDSFQNGLLSEPIYTRPAIFRGLSVPEILLSGNFKAIGEWRINSSLERTKKNRPDLLK